MASQVADCLTASLSPDSNTRIAAELRLAELFTLPDTGLALSQIILSQEADLPLRQSATIVLRKYIKERWSPYFVAFKGSPPPPEIKSQIREAVFQGLSDGNRKIRTLCAHTLSSIANCDWPDEYPDLLSKLLKLLASGSPDSVHGAMQVFTEFIKADLTEDQILPVLRELLPVLLTILGSTDTYSPLTRARTISVFRECVTALFMVKEQHPQAVKEATASVLPVWLDAFKVLLNIDPEIDLANTENWDGLAIRIQVFKTLDTIHTSFSRSLGPYAQDYLIAALTHLQKLYPTFMHYYLNSPDSVPRSSEDESIELPQLISPIFDFVSAVTRESKARSWLNAGNLVPLINAVFNLVQMTNEDEETWASNANAFVAQEDDETQAYSVRVAGFDLLTSLMDRLPRDTTKAFHTVLHHVLQSSQQNRDAGQKDWWRPLEAAFAAVGAPAEVILECIEDEQDAGREKPIDIEFLLTNVIPSILRLSEYPFLQGRAFVFASQFSRLLPSSLSGQYLEAAVQVLEANEATIPAKISAVKAIHNFCEASDDSVLIPFATRIAKDLGPFLFVTTEDTLSLVLETLSVILEVKTCDWISVELADSLVVAILEIWSKNNKDPILLSILTDMMSTLAASPASGVYEVVIKQALPSLSNAIGSSKKEESWIAASAIELVTSLVEGSPKSGLAEGFFAVLAPSLFQCLGEAEDRDVLQNGITCLTAMIRKDHKQIVSWSDASGRTGLDYVLTLIAKILENHDESGGLAIGDLIIHLLRNVGEAILPVLPQLLQAMIARMVNAKTATFIQSLVIPFAFLINNQRDTVISLLESTQIQGRSGLDILIQTWCENAETFQGFWPSRISTLALSQLFLSERPSLQNLTVKGDIIVRPEQKNVIMTRSRTKTTPHEFTSIHFPLKALKILIHEVQSEGDAATITAQGAGKPYDVDSDDGEDEWSDEEKLNQGFKEDEFSFLSEMIGPKGVNLDNEDILEDTDDPDLRNDPVSQMDMQAHLATFFRECAARNTNSFATLVDNLSVEETLVIRHILNV